MIARTTLLVPFLNGGNEKWLDECIGSFPKDLPFIVVRNDGELSEALNQGLAQIETDLVMVMGADDVALPDCLRLLESLIWDVDVTYPAMLRTDVDLKPFSVWPAYPFCPHRLEQWNFVPGAFLARTEKLRKIGGWRDLEGFEDWDLHLRNYRAGARFKPVPEAQIAYRQVPGSRNKLAIEQDGFRQSWRDRIVGSIKPVRATFYYQATPATTYLRCQLPARYLPGRCLPDFELEMDEKTLGFPDHEGAAIFQFPGDKMKALIATVAMPGEGIRVLIETDDNYLVSMPHRKKQGWEMRIGQGHHSLQGHRYIVEKADGVIVATEQLASVYRKLNPHIYVCPNSLDPTDWPLMMKLDDGVLRIGWFASDSHAEDAGLVRRALEWAASQPNVEVITMGFNPTSWRFRRRHIPWSNDMATYWQMMGQLDIGVAPVVANPWAICRSDLKALEYAMAGAIPVLSGEPPYHMWENERGCLKARDAKGFLHAIKRLVQNRDEVKDLAADARDYVLKERTIMANIHKWEEAVNGG